MKKSFSMTAMLLVVTITSTVTPSVVAFADTAKIVRRTEKQSTSGDNLILKSESQYKIPQAISEVADENNEKVYVFGNDLWNSFQTALDELQNTREYLSSTQEKQAEKLQELMMKYDGAEVTYSFASDEENNAKGTSYVGAVSRSGFSEKLVNGGVNDFASTKTGLANLRDFYGVVQVEWLAGGTAAGARIGGVIGAVFGAIGGSILSSRASAAQSDIKSWIAKGSTKGGARMTLTAEFPIASLNSTTQFAIKKL